MTRARHFAFAIATAALPLLAGAQTKIPAAYSLISDYFERRRRALAISFYAIGYPIGGGLALLFGGWLLGHFALAVHRVTGDAEGAQALLTPMRDALADQGLGTIGEIFDGDPPHDPRGAPSQAWSVACTLQAWHALQQAIAQTKGP